MRQNPKLGTILAARVSLKGSEHSLGDSGAIYEDQVNVGVGYRRSTVEETGATEALAMDGLWLIMWEQ